MDDYTMGPRTADAAPVMASTDPHLTKEMREQILLFLLKKELGMPRFIDLLKNAGTELEVYGLVENGDAMKAVAEKIEEKHDQKMDRVILMTAIRLAILAGDHSGKLYLKAEKEEHEAMDMILERYRDSAVEEINSIIAEASRKVITMNGPEGALLQEALGKLK